MENFTENILIFATNIKTENDKQKIINSLNEHSEIHEWNIDQEDIDCVLRVVSKTLTEEQIIQLVDQHNFECVALE